jgi:hypothetical protein
MQTAHIMDDSFMKKIQQFQQKSKDVVAKMMPGQQLPVSYNPPPDTEMSEIKTKPKAKALDEQAVPLWPGVSHYPSVASCTATPFVVAPPQKEQQQQRSFLVPQQQRTRRSSFVCYLRPHKARVTKYVERRPPQRSYLRLVVDLASLVAVLLCCYVVLLMRWDDVDRAACPPCPIMTPPRVFPVLPVQQEEGGAADLFAWLSWRH